ncbi:alpha-L-arabinofuranosidase C-terminal domain-containing protein [Sphingobacterium chungjuense]|uniref:alpha-L-arabinofuranosidase C-terminal domain-containing protein n=1 Tax=Sphingobacterium chungjuense TaxID=2675553 RepID=UPI00140BBB88|nr:alpha-L-arabinofuranosidase C-terminal domain-containing protein [Sphingobacterium chungjuense]
MAFTGKHIFSRKNLLKIALLAAALQVQSNDVSAQDQKTFTVDMNKPKGEINPNMWGIFFEDINMGADGGIYAELIKNRSFEFFRPMMGWEKLGKNTEASMTILNRQEEEHQANPRYLRVDTRKADTTLGLKNEGFRGMGIKEGLAYDFSVLYRQANAGIRVKLELLDSTGQVIAETAFQPTADVQNWQSAEARLVATKTDPKGSFRMWFEGKGVIDLDMISLFPEDTWKGRKKGLRADMVQALADLKPGFIRFPGGCIVEGFDLSQRFQWKKTVGAIEDRQLIINRWNTEFAHRLTPDYFQTFGLGFYEYFLMAEDIGAEPLPILNCGMACQFNTGELVPLDELDPYIQDAIDLIEFANGSVNTTWGKVRAEMGHPEPFNLKLLGVGNENWGPQYVERLAVFQKILKEKHPEVEIIASAGPYSSGEYFDYLDKELRTMNVDIIDEHFYQEPKWFLNNAKRYDNYDRQGPKIFAGEYAAHSRAATHAEQRNNWEAALSEAAFLTGLERNADVVQLASYAPLFAHAEGWQWNPNLIWVDNMKVYPTPSYYVQKAYSNNRGTHILSLLDQGAAVAGQDSVYASAVLDEEHRNITLKLVNVSGQAKQIALNLNGSQKLAKNAQVEFITANDLGAFNAVGKELRVVPQQTTLPVNKKKLDLPMQPHAFYTIKITY